MAPLPDPGSSQGPCRVVDQVTSVDVLTSLGMSHHIDAFLFEGILMSEDLLHLSRQELYEIGVRDRKEGARLKKWIAAAKKHQEECGSGHDSWENIIYAPKSSYCSEEEKKEDQVEADQNHPKQTLLFDSEVEKASRAQERIELSTPQENVCYALQRQESFTFQLIRSMKQAWYIAVIDPLVPGNVRRSRWGRMLFKQIKG